MSPGRTDAVWDVAVVGAGPAGATAALAALVEQPSARVLLLDRERFPRDKCCGDGIAAHVLDVLAPLGAADVVRGWTPLRRLDLARGPCEVRGRMARPAWVIPREVLDARLVDVAVAAGARLARHRVRSVRADGDAMVIDDQHRARTVVAADGAYSAVRATFPGRVAGPRAIAIRGYAPTPRGRSGRQVIRWGVQRPQPSYAWSFDRGDGLSNVGYGELVGRQERPSRALLLDQLDALIPGTVEHGTGWRGHHLPLSGWDWRAAQPDGPVLFAGDAAGLVNPMTGEGIYYAVATGASAGRHAVAAAVTRRAGTAGALHRAAVHRLLGRHLHHTWLAARLARHPAVVEAGIAAAAGDQQVFDDLVEIGLGGGRLTPRLVRSLAVDVVRTRRTPTGRN